MIAAANTSVAHFDWFCDQFDVRRRSHNNLRAHAICPAHADRTPSLDIDFKDGQILTTCRAGCTNEAILAAAGLDPSAYFRVPFDRAATPRFERSSLPPQTSSWGNETGRWVYRMPDGSRFGEVVRFDPPGMRKQVIPHHQSASGLCKGIGPKPWPLYRADTLASLPPNSLVFLPAGEKCADAVAGLGLNATAHQGGEGAWKDHYASWLAGFDVVVCEDNDDQGRKWGERVAQSLLGVAASVRRIRFPELPEKGDVYDWIAAGNDRDALIQRAQQAPVVSSGGAASEDREEGVPAFPVWVFPEAVRTYIEQGAAAIGAPVDFIAVPFLGFVAGIAGNRRPIQLKGGWVERPILWTAIVGRPGTAKTPAIKHAQGPIDELQRRAYSDYQQRMDTYEQLCAEQKGHKTAAPAPRLAHLFSTDITLEALAANLDGSPGLAVIREEIVGWVESHDAYRKAGDRQSYLSLWAGQALKVDRRTTASVYVPHPAVSVVGGIQPDLLTRLKDEADRQDGFLDRFLFSWPEAKAMGWTDDEVDPNVLGPVVDILQRIRDVAPEDPADAIAHLDPVAKKLFAAWVNANAEITEQLNGLAAGFNAKLPTQLARLVAVLHSLDHPNQPNADVAEETVERGIALVEYFRGHLMRVLPSFGCHERLSAGRLTERIRNKIGPEWMGKSQLRTELGRRGFTKEELDEALGELEQTGEIVSQVTSTGGRPRKEYREKICHMPKGSVPEGLRHTADMPKGSSDEGLRHTAYFLTGSPRVCVTCGVPLPPDRTEECATCTGKRIVDFQRQNPDAWGVA